MRKEMIGPGIGQFASVPQFLPYGPGEWVMMSDLTLNGVMIVPKYFITDFASIPWIVQPVFSSLDMLIEFIPHDWGYCLNEKSRADCDNLLSDIMERSKPGDVRCDLIYAGVRAGGWYRYSQCKGGPKREDFAWELMSDYEVLLYESAYKLGNSHAGSSAR